MQGIQESLHLTRYPLLFSEPSNYPLTIICHQTTSMRF